MTDADRVSANDSAGKFGMRLFLAALTMLFGASLIGYLVVRSRAASWPPPGIPRLPAGLWASTVILLLGSITIAWALRSARRDRQELLRAALLITLLLGVLFLASQTLNWFYLVLLHLPKRANLYAFTFYMLTGLHALHVVGGLILLAYVTVRAHQGRYSPASHAPLAHCATYWHYLDAVWLVLFTVLYLLG